ncbi:MAG TPA: glycosyltransferase [Nevskiaceae bacterium]|nr:glycosyltransferase [Nevskiaceae bacterium]
MIFITVGTTKFPFTRLLKAVDKVMMNFKKKEKLVVQAGTSDYQFQHQNAQVFREVPFDKMVAFLKKSRQIICHGGPATIFLALKYGKNKPLVVPRTKKFGEHVDNHEVFFARFLKKKKKVAVVLPQEDLALKLKESFGHPIRSQGKKEIKPAKKLIKKLIKLTQ